MNRIILIAGIIPLLFLVVSCSSGGSAFPLYDDLNPPEWERTVGVTSIEKWDGAVTVYWDTAIDTQNPPLTYLVYIDTDDNPWDAIPVDRASNEPYTFYGLDNSTTYWFGVRCRDKAVPPNYERNTNVLNSGTPSSTQLINTIDLPNYFVFSVALDGDYAYLGTKEGDFIVLDISNPAVPQEVASLKFDNQINEIVISQGYAYLLHYKKLKVVDIHNPHAPEIVGGYEPYYNLHSLAVSGNRAMASRGIEMLLLDVSNPSTPTTLDTFSYDSQFLPYFTTPVIRDNYAFCISTCYFFEPQPARTETCLEVMDISNPGNLNVISRECTLTTAVDLAISGDFAFAVDNFYLQVIDISNPAVPLWCDIFYIFNIANLIKTAGMYAYVADENKFTALNIANPYNPYVISSLEFTYKFNDMAVLNNHAVLVDNIGDVHIVQLW